MLDMTPLKKPLDQARVLEHVYQSNHADVQNRNNPEGKFLLYQITKKQQMHWNERLKLSREEHTPGFPLQPQLNCSPAEHHCRDCIKI